MLPFNLTSPLVFTISPIIEDRRDDFPVATYPITAISYPFLASKLIFFKIYKSLLFKISISLVTGSAGILVFFLLFSFYINSSL